MGKIADAFVEIGANDKPFRERLKDLVYEGQRLKFSIREALKDAFSADGVENLVERITGSGDAATIAGGLIRAGFGKALLAVTAVTAAVGATAVALDALFSRDDDQKFADSVAGLTTGFRGLAEEIKQTDKKITEIMERDATGGNGGWFSLSSWKALGERLVGIESMSSQIARNMNNAATASKLYADNLVKAAQAGQMQSDERAGAEMFAGLRQTAAQQEEQKANAEAIKRILDEQGGVRFAEQIREYLRNNPDLVPGGSSPQNEANRLAGAAERGAPEAVALISNIFDVAGERAKMAVEEFMKAIPVTNELAKLEEDRIAAQRDAALFQFDMAKRQQDLLKFVAQEQEKQAKLRQKEVDEMNKKTQKASEEMLKLEEEVDNAKQRREEFLQGRAEQLRSSFQFAGLGEARDRLFMAAQDAKKDELTASKMQGEIDRVVKALDSLKLKWNMV